MGGRKALFFLSPLQRAKRERERDTIVTAYKARTIYHYERNKREKRRKKRREKRRKREKREEKKRSSHVRLFSLSVSFLLLFSLVLVSLPPLCSSPQTPRSLYCDVPSKVPCFLHRQPERLCSSLYALFFPFIPRCFFFFVAALIRSRVALACVLPALRLVRRSRFSCGRGGAPARSASSFLQCGTWPPDPVSEARPRVSRVLAWQQRPELKHGWLRGSEAKRDAQREDESAPMSTCKREKKLQAQGLRLRLLLCPGLIRRVQGQGKKKRPRAAGGGCALPSFDADSRKHPSRLALASAACSFP